MKIEKKLSPLERAVLFVLWPMIAVAIVLFIAVAMTVAWPFVPFLATREVGK